MRLLSLLLVGVLLSACAPAQDPFLPGPRQVEGPGVPVQEAVPAAPVTFRPEALGAPGTCYWVQSPEEVTALVEQGLCQAGDRPLQAPLAWQHTYHGWYSSPAYYGVFVPLALRAAWPSRSAAFGRRHTAAIRAAAAAGRWTGSDGLPYDGASVVQRTGGGPGLTAPASRPASPRAVAPASAPASPRPAATRRSTTTGQQPGTVSRPGGTVSRPRRR